MAQAQDISRLLTEYISVHDKILQTAGTFKSLFKSNDFFSIYKEVDEVKINFEIKANELKDIKEEYYGSFADVSMEFFDALESYFNALFDAVKQLHLLSFRLYETSKGIINNNRELSWTEYSQLTKMYDEKVKRYTDLGDKLNRAYQALESEENDFIDDENINNIESDKALQSEEYQPTEFGKKMAAALNRNALKEANRTMVLGEEIDPDNMPKLYRWAKENPETLERQLKSIAKVWHNGDIRSAMIAFESDLEHDLGLVEEQEPPDKFQPTEHGKIMTAAFIRNALKENNQ